jgi:endoglucanase
MNERSRTFLTELLGTISPSGYEHEATAVWRGEAASFADRVWQDLHGNAYALVCASGSPSVALAGHIDELGLMVTSIDDEGFLGFTTIGHWDPQTLPGQRVRIQTERGTVLGAIGRKPFHLLREERDWLEKAVRVRDLWIDLGVDGKEDATELVSIGDPAVLDYGFEELRNGYMVARGFDDRIGAFVVLETIRRLTSMSPQAAVCAVATVQEELGTRGAITSTYGVDPLVGIAVDVNFTTNTPGARDARRQHGDFDLAKGPILTRGPNINPLLFDLLVQTAENHGIPYQVRGESTMTGTDARAMQVSRAGVATAVVSIPNRYMHSPCEIVHLTDVEHAIELLAHVASSINDALSFTVQS